ncbi:MAG: serine/threonine-protein kinase, partial [Pseudomonadota bacterium]
HDIVDTDGALFLVQEYCAGASLKAMIRRRGEGTGGLPIGEVVAIAIQVLDGLAMAHAQGVVHRDIKPDNILVSDGGVAKIADFGLARTDWMIGLTTHSMVLGTPEYLAPEIAHSPSSGVDGRADLYSLGVTMFEALTGRLPFRASSPMQLLAMHQNAVPPDPRELRADLPARLGQVVLRAMAMDPEERYATAEEMRHDLQTVFDPALDPTFNLAANPAASPAPCSAPDPAPGPPAECMAEVQPPTSRSQRPQTRVPAQIHAQARIGIRGVNVPDSRGGQGDTVVVAQPARSPQHEMTHARGRRGKQRHVQAMDQALALAPTPVLQQDAGTVACPRCGERLVPALSFCIDCGWMRIRSSPPAKRGASHRVFIRLKRRRRLLGLRGRLFLLVRTLRVPALSRALTCELRARMLDTLRLAGAHLNYETGEIDRRLKCSPSTVIAEGLDVRGAEMLAGVVNESLAGANVEAGTAATLATYLRNARLPVLPLCLVSAALVYGIGLAKALDRVPSAVGAMVLATLSLLVLFVGTTVLIEYRLLTKPLVSFPPVDHHEESRAGPVHPLVARAAAALRELGQPRPRSLVRQLLGRALALRVRLEKSPLLGAGMVARLDRLFDSAVGMVKRVARLEEDCALVDEAAVIEQLESLDVRIAAATNTADTEELIERKLQLKALLAEHDDQQRQRTVLVGKLLKVSTDMDRLALQIDLL